jgi:hypothetical protein
MIMLRNSLCYKKKRKQLIVQKLLFLLSRHLNLIKINNLKSLKSYNFYCIEFLINIFHQQVPLPVPCVNFTQITDTGLDTTC